MMNTKKYTLISAAVMVVFVVLFLGLFSRQEKITTGFDIIVVPADSEIFIDGNKANSSINKTTPGKHSIVIKRNDFITHKSIITSLENKIISIPIGLIPSNESGDKWKQDHNDEYLKLDGLISQQVNAESESAVKAYPMIKDLPQDISSRYRIDYGVSKKFPTDSTKIAIYISYTSSTDKAKAIEYIYSIGYDPSDYEIVFERM